VSASIGRHEEIQCPWEFQELLTSIFGVNPFGDPLFRIIWGQTETMDVASPHGTGYFKRYIGHGQPCWIIQRWRPPEIFGTPDLYYQLMADPTSGLPLAGEYPQFGMYETVTPLMTRSLNAETGELEVKTIPLDWEIIERAIPLLQKAEQMTEAERQAALDAIEAAENAAIVAKIAERLYEELPTFYGPVSHAQRRMKRGEMQQREEAIERKWKQFGRPKPRRGFFQEQN